MEGSAAPRGAAGHGRPAVEKPAGEPPYDPLLAFETILERSQLNITLIDCDLVVCDVSRGAAQLEGLSRAEMIGRSLRDYLPPECIADHERMLGGETLEMEAKLTPEVCAEEPWTRALLVPIRDAEGVVHGGMTIVADVSQEKHAEELIEQLSFIDPLTKLPNRRMLSMMLGNALSGAKARRRQLALVWLNLDRFQDVNDALGHETGDLLLQAVAERLHEALRTNDLVARVGADDFVLILPRIGSRAHLERLIERIHGVFAAPFLAGDEAVGLSASCGVAVHPNGGGDAHELEEHAHRAMRAAKRLGGGACELFEAGLVEDSAGRLRLVGEMREGITKGHFVLHYQPQLTLSTMRVQALEALVRWDHPERGLLPPAEFMQVAEETALIVPLGRDLMRRACGEHSDWHGHVTPAPRLAFNVSPREFQRGDLCDQVSQVAGAIGFPAELLEIEITETAVLADPQRAAQVLAGLREQGATIALDDFGTGYSSLTHLRDLPIDRIKIDRSFVGSCLSDRSAAAILVAVTHLAHDLGTEVVAEGVETQATLDFVRAVGCDAAQGYHLSMPLTAGDCSDYLLRAGQGPMM
jgi:diguanylate cyclase (GGDEF)-like protein/PAS domain S-box-containing protein